MVGHKAEGIAFNKHEHNYGYRTSEGEKIEPTKTVISDTGG
jgi:hypothetical protein